MDTNTARHFGYRPEIDGLRAVAVLSVIFYHAGLPGFSGGYVGVDIFFVISGFLITSIIAREIVSGEFTFAKFYERRIRRILPAMFLVTAVSSIAGWFILSPEQLKDYGQSVVATMGFAANIYFFMNSGYFSADIGTLPMIHMWSLAVEEQFYVLFPIMLLVLMRLFPRSVAATLGAVLMLSLMFSIGAQEHWPSLNFYLAPLRAWELLAGSLLAVSGAPLTAWLGTRRSGMALQWLGVALVVVPIAFYTDKTPFPGLAAVPPVLGTVILIATDAKESLVRRLLIQRPMVAVGLISYSAYLWHQPIFAFALIGNGAPLGTNAKLALIILTLAAAWMSWRFIERPFRGKGRFTRKQMFTFALTGSLLLAAFGLLLHYKGGFPERFDQSARELAETMVPQPERNRCHTEGTAYRRPENACRFGGSETEWAVLGDSHGVELAYALGETLKPEGRGVIQLTFSGCPPAYAMATHNPGCSEWTRMATDWVASQPATSKVLLTYRHNFHLFGDQTQTYPELPSADPLFAGVDGADAARDAYVESLSLQVRQLLAAGKQVYLLAPIPELPVHVERFVFTANGKHPAHGTTRKWHLARSARIAGELAKLARLPGVTIVDPADTVCGPLNCEWRRGKTVLYFDDNHLSLAGARLLAKDVLAIAGQHESKAR